PRARAAAPAAAVRQRAGAQRQLQRRGQGLSRLHPARTELHGRPGAGEPRGHPRRDRGPAGSRDGHQRRPRSGPDRRAPAMKTAAAALVLACLPVGLFAQSLGAAAEREREKRAKQTGQKPPAPSFTDEDLKKDDPKAKDKDGKDAKEGSKEASKESRPAK